MNCSKCYNLALPECTDTLLIPIGDYSGSNVTWSISDKFGNKWYGVSVVSNDLEISIQTDLFDKGLFTRFSGNFKFSLLGVNGDPDRILCDPILIKVCGVKYECISISFYQRNKVDE